MLIRHLLSMKGPAGTASPPASASTTLSLLLIFCCSSWLLVAAGRRSITHLPGFVGPLPVELETGYVTVGDSDDVNLFYYFVKSERDPAEDPVLLWLTGGPGCSALSGMVYEIGPLKFVSDTDGGGGLPRVVYRRDSWTKVCSVIFLDSPVGTGFSYSTTEAGLRTGDVKSSKDVYAFLRRWFTDHPEFLSNALYICGDSYSGLTLPVVVQEVSDGIRAGDKPLLNLKGYTLGNPLTDDGFDGGAVVPHAHGMGLISDELYEAARRSCGGGDYANPRNAECGTYVDAVNEALSELNTAHILEPLCFVAAPKPEQYGAARRRYLEEYARTLLATEAARVEETDAGRLYLRRRSYPPECRSYGYLLSHAWANDERVREALGIRQGSVREWKRCSYGPNYTSDVRSTVAYHLNLSGRGYRALVYSGDHDMIVPFMGTQAWIRSLNFTVVDDWRSWKVAGDVAGYTRTYSNSLTFATVKGGGHTAPEYRPKQCLAMIDRWLSGRAL